MDSPKRSPDRTITLVFLALLCVAGCVIAGIASYLSRWSYQDLLFETLGGLALFAFLLKIGSFDRFLKP
jgi:hypothetical protein